MHRRPRPDRFSPEAFESEQSAGPPDLRRPRSSTAMAKCGDARPLRCAARPRRRLCRDWRGSDPGLPSSGLVGHERDAAVRGAGTSGPALRGLRPAGQQRPARRLLRAGKLIATRPPTAAPRQAKVADGAGCTANTGCLSASCKSYLCADCDLERLHAGRGDIAVDRLIGLSADRVVGNCRHWEFREATSHEKIAQLRPCPTSRLGRRADQPALGTASQSRRRRQSGIRPSSANSRSQPPSWSSPTTRPPPPSSSPSPRVRLEPKGWCRRPRRRASRTARCRPARSRSRSRCFPAVMLVAAQRRRSRRVGRPANESAISPRSLPATVVVDHVEDRPSALTDAAPPDRRIDIGDSEPAGDWRRIVDCHRHRGWWPVPAVRVDAPKRRDRVHRRSRPAGGVPRSR